MKQLYFYFPVVFIPYLHLINADYKILELKKCEANQRFIQMEICNITKGYIFNARAKLVKELDAIYVSVIFVDFYKKIGEF